MIAEVIYENAGHFENRWKQYPADAKPATQVRFICMARRQTREQLRDPSAWRDFADWELFSELDRLC